MSNLNLGITNVSKSFGCGESARRYTYHSVNQDSSGAGEYEIFVVLGVDGVDPAPPPPPSQDPPIVEFFLVQPLL